MTETHGRVKTRDGHTGPAGTHRPGGARLCVTQPHRVTAGPASQGATAWQARQHGRGESQIPVTTPAAAGGEAARGKRPGQRCLVLTLLAVILVDQAAKWWAWRHLTGVTINPGGDFLTGPTIGSWYANPLAGALLDLVDFGLVGTAAAILARRRHLAVTVCGSLMVGGWASNLLDRLGMHYWTAPGSVRGAVDFISAGGRSWNLADFFIIGATPLFLLATTQLARRGGRPAAARAGRPRTTQLPAGTGAGRGRGRRRPDDDRRPRRNAPRQPDQAIAYQHQKAARVRAGLTSRSGGQTSWPAVPERSLQDRGPALAAASRRIVAEGPVQAVRRRVQASVPTAISRIAPRVICS